MDPTNIDGHRGVVTGSEVGARALRSSRSSPSMSAPNFLNLELFHTTNEDDSAIDAPAISGFRNPAAASGMAARLYANAHARFP